MTKDTLKKGFTLIELLVVIAIIGILAATVLAALGSARSSGNNASAQSSVSSVRAQAEIFFNSQNPGTYVGMCASLPVRALTLGARNNGQGGTDAAAAPLLANNTTASAWSAAAAGNVTACHETARTWAVSVPLNGLTPGNFYCADSTGAGRVTAAALGAGIFACS